MFLIMILIIAIVFSVGILLGKYMATKEQQDISMFMKDLELNTESFLVEQELIGKTADCGLTESRITSLSTELYELGVMLSEPDAEATLGKDNFKLLKKKFHLMQVRTYMLYNTFMENCKTDEHVVLFYYGKDEPDSKEQGKILDEAVKKYPLNIFAVEYNYTKELNFMEDYYGIKQTPSIVIDFDNVRQGLVTYEDVVNTIS